MCPHLIKRADVGPSYDTKNIFQVASAKWLLLGRKYEGGVTTKKKLTAFLVSTGNTPILALKTTSIVNSKGGGICLVGLRQQKVTKKTILKKLVITVVQNFVSWLQVKKDTKNQKNTTAQSVKKSLSVALQTPQRYL